MTRRIFSKRSCQAEWNSGGALRNSIRRNHHRRTCDSTRTPDVPQAGPNGPPAPDSPADMERRFQQSRETAVQPILPDTQPKWATGLDHDRPVARSFPSGSIRPCLLKLADWLVVDRPVFQRRLAVAGRRAEAVRTPSIGISGRSWNNSPRSLRPPGPRC